jgi:uncharacterized damage-inducible protein DinB
MSRRAPASIVVGLLMLAAPAAGAQTKDQMVADWVRNRETVLAYIDAMPDSALAFRPTPGVRSFAQQIDHIVGTNLEVASRALRNAQEAPFTADTAVYLNDKAALRAYAARTYDYVLEALRGATSAQLSRTSTMFGENTHSGARWMEMAREHAAWTLGQVVPYLRLNGVTPPEYKQPF